MVKDSASSVILKGLARRKVYLMLGLFYLLALYTDIPEEYGFRHIFALDDLGITSMMLIMILFIIFTWKKKDSRHLKLTVNLATVLVGIAIIFQIAGIIFEYGTPFFANEPVIYGLIILFINRFV